MKILLIDVNCKQGSTGKIVYDLYQHIQLSGNKAMICYGRGDVVKEPMISRFSPVCEMLSHAFLSRITGLNGYFSPIATKRLLKTIDDYQPDIVHIHDPKTYYMNIGTLVQFLAKKNIPVVWTFHSEYMYTGKCGYANECLQWKTHCRKCPQLSGYPKSLFFDWTSKMFDDKQKWMEQISKLEIVCPSKWLAERVKESFLKDRSISVIHNGINTVTFCRKECDDLRKQYKDKQIVLSVAPDLMSERKGGHWVLQLAKRMSGIKNLHFIMIGCDESENMIPHSSNVTILPRIYDQELLAKYYSLASVFLICSSRENFPTTAIEAQCCGAPVVGFDTGGTKETATDEYSMRLVPYGDLAGLEENAKHYLLHYSEKEQSELASKAGTLFSPQKMFEDYYSIYTKIIS